jgi:hypothetical protein
MQKNKKVGDKLPNKIIADFIAGSKYVLKFPLTGSNNIPITEENILDIKWTFTRYGDIYSTLEKSLDNGITFDENGIIQVVLSTTDTQNIYGKFISQLLVTLDTDTNTNDQYVEDNGFILIRKSINNL